MVSGTDILKKVCYMTSFTAIHFFCDSVIISRQHLKQPRCQGNCLYFKILFATIHYNKRSAVDSRKSWRVCLFEENHCSPAVLKVAIYSTEQVAIIFVWKVVKYTKALTEITFVHGEPAERKYRHFFKRIKYSAESKVIMKLNLLWEMFLF